MPRLDHGAYPFAGKLVTALPQAYAAGAFDTRFAFGQQGRRPT
jgi:hypothetical protein